MNNFLKLITIYIVLGFVFSINVDTASAYGWGYKKAKDHQPPDIGEYADVLENHQAFYRDLTEDKVIYFTFDNGYEQGYTEQILDVLKEEEVPATFFVTGHYTESEPELIKRMVDDGHIIGNHSFHHLDFTKMSKEEIEEELVTLEKAVAKVSDQNTMTYLRPPRGTFNEQSLKWGDELGYVHVFWSLAFKDWETNKQQGWKYAYEQIMDQVHPGAIVLLHTVSEDNAKALQKVILQLKKDGYSFQSLDELMLKQSLPEDLHNILFP